MPQHVKSSLTIPACIKHIADIKIKFLTRKEVARNTGNSYKTGSGHIIGSCTARIIQKSNTIKVELKCD